MTRRAVCLAETKRDDGLTVSFKVGKVGIGRRKKLAAMDASEDGMAGEKQGSVGRLPRITRLMALAIHYQGQIDRGVVANHADIARLMGVTRARVTQIMNLTLLAPELQEKILFLSKVFEGDDPVAERHVRRVVREWKWIKQMEMWKSLRNDKRDRRAALPGHSTRKVMSLSRRNGSVRNEKTPLQYRAAFLFFVGCF